MHGGCAVLEVEVEVSFRHRAASPGFHGMGVPELWPSARHLRRSSLAGLSLLSNSAALDRSAERPVGDPSVRFGQVDRHQISKCASRRRSSRSEEKPQLPDSDTLGQTIAADDHPRIACCHISVSKDGQAAGRCVFDITSQVQTLVPPSRIYRATCSTCVLSCATTRHLQPRQQQTKSSAHLILTSSAGVRPRDAALYISQSYMAT